MLIECSDFSALDFQRLLTATYVTPDGRSATEISTLPATMQELTNVKLEKTLGQIRPDIMAETENGPDADKKALIEDIGISAIEIALPPELLQECRGWDQLTEVVINDPLNRTWIYNTDASRLKEEAMQQKLRFFEMTLHYGPLQ